MIDEAELRARLAGFTDPDSGADLATVGAIRAIGVAGDRVAVELEFGYPLARHGAALEEAVRAWLKADPRIAEATVAVRWRVRAHRVQEGVEPLPGVRNLIAVASGKGGVGKSTIAINLALGLAVEGARVGVLDADIYGPSQPRMTQTAGRLETDAEQRLVPKSNMGLRVMSIGYLIEEDTPMIWRGPMVTQALQQLLHQTDWGELDYLVIDLPPGTGDIHLTLCQRVPLAGAVIVTTPQDIALLDAKKGLKMFEKVRVPVLGIVENMSTHVCSRCGHEEAVFGQGGGAAMAAQYGVPLLGQVPLDPRIRSDADQGRPTVHAAPESDLGLRFRAIARAAAARLARQEREKRMVFPSIVVSQS